MPEVPEEAVTKPGDIWLLGEHRLLCGDTTIYDDVKKLMQDDVAAMIFTDPPYNVNYGSTMKDSLRYHAGTLGGRKIMNDNLGDGFCTISSRQPVQPYDVQQRSSVCLYEFQRTSYSLQCFYRRRWQMVDFYHLGQKHFHTWTGGLSAAV